MNRALLACLAILALGAPAYAQLSGTDIKPGDACTPAEEGYIARNASADRDTSEITLICDGSVWQSATGGSDTLAGLSCGDGQVASWDDGGGAWVCSDVTGGGSTFSCPSGFTLVENAGYALGCIQNAEQGTGNFTAAGAACYTAHGGRLPSYSEIKTAFVNYSLSNETDSSEWVDSASSGSSGPSGGYITAGGTAGATAISNSMDYRCFIPASGGTGFGSDTLAALSCGDGQVASWDDGGGVWVCSDVSGGGGASALDDLTDAIAGANNVFLGQGAGEESATGLYNTAVGPDAMGAVTGGTRNVAVGYGALSALGGGLNNIAIGYNAGNNINGGLSNIIIGHDIDAPGGSGSSETLTIGNLIFGTDLDGTGTTISSGNVGIGTTAPGQKLTVAGTIESTSGGVKFPDGTTQTTAASGGGFQTGMWCGGRKVTGCSGSTTAYGSPNIGCNGTTLTTTCFHNGETWQVTGSVTCPSGYSGLWSGTSFSDNGIIACIKN